MSTLAVASSILAFHWRRWSETVWAQLLKHGSEVSLEQLISVRNSWSWLWKKQSQELAVCLRCVCDEKARRSLCGSFGSQELCAFSVQAPRKPLAEAFSQDSYDNSKKRGIYCAKTLHGTHAEAFADFCCGSSADSSFRNLDWGSVLNCGGTNLCGTFEGVNRYSIKYLQPGFRHCPVMVSGNCRVAFSVVEHAFARGQPSSSSSAVPLSKMSHISITHDR